MLSKLIGCVFALLLVCSFVSAQSYSISEQQLQQLEKIQSSQQTLITQQAETLKDLNTQIQSYQEQTKTLKEYSSKLERKVAIRNNIITITIGISVGCVAGVVVAHALQ